MHATNRTVSVVQSYNLKIKNRSNWTKSKYPAHLYILTHQLLMGLDWSPVTALSCLIPTYLLSFMMQVSRTSSRALNPVWPTKKKKMRGSWITNQHRVDLIRSLFLLLFTPTTTDFSGRQAGQVGDDGLEKNRGDIISIQAKETQQLSVKDDTGSKWRSWRFHPAVVNSFNCSHWLWRLITNK